MSREEGECMPGKTQAAEEDPPISQMFRGFADEVRLAILETLRRAGPTSVGELSGELGLGHTLVSTHLGVLRKSGLVTMEKEGTSARYSLRDQRIAQVIQLVEQLALGGIERQRASMLEGLCSILRIDLLDALCERSYTVAELAEKVGQTSAIVAKHLRKLCWVRLVVIEQESRPARYGLRDNRVPQLVGIVKRILEQRPGKEQEVLRALADESRIRILHLLRQENYFVADIIRETGLEQSNTSFHLRILRETHIAVRVQYIKSKYREYALCEPEIPFLLQLIEELLQ
jgi:ArsR family transcriptional regulator, zinc-responsive transcriptional repressor